jgi:hypothetical protein
VSDFFHRDSSRTDEPTTPTGRRLARRYYNGGAALAVEDAVAIEEEARQQLRDDLADQPPNVDNSAL